MIDLIGDGIENPWNAKTMVAAARMFGSQCYFRDRKKLLQSTSELIPELKIQLIEPESLYNFSPVIALENLDCAEDIYGFSAPQNARIALVAGNEKFGIAKDMLARCHHVVQIPMPGINLNTINVAAASAVALYYLSVGSRARLQVRGNPGGYRPQLLLMAPTCHVEAGSALRSAGAFGWTRVALDDRNGIWFGADRATCAEGRAAARRARNTLRVDSWGGQSLDRLRIPVHSATIVTCTSGTPLTKAHLARGPNHALVIPDEQSIHIEKEDWRKIAKHIEFVSLDVPVNVFDYHFRLPATIAMAECARQVGATSTRRSRRRAGRM